METRKILVILVLALSLMVWPAQVCKAEPMGTAFTYQGRLTDGNSPAEGLYDLSFKLYDANTDGNQVGADVNRPDVDVVDGYFTVILDFADANAFNGQKRWLSISARDGELQDPNVYTVLEPRQQVTPTPYALGVRVPLRLTGTLPNEGVISGINNATYRGIGVYGEATDDDGYGVYGKVTGWDSYGVYGEAYTEDSDAIRGRAGGQAHNAVAGTHMDGNTNGYLGTRFYGVYGEHWGSGSFGFLGSSQYGVYGGSSRGWAGYFSGNVTVANGRVGIGTSSPQQHLEISEDKDGFVGMYITNKSTGGLSSEGIYFNNEDGTITGIRIKNNDTMAIFNNRPDGCFSFHTQGVQRLVISNEGNVGIRRIDPNVALDVNGAAALEIGAEVNEFSTDGTLGDNSDSAVPTEKAVKTYVDAQATGVVPVGAVVAWLKSFSGTPGLPDNFVQCDGQTLSDPKSPYDGQSIPNLNGASAGTQRFLRGATSSGAMGGADRQTTSVPTQTVNVQSGFNTAVSDDAHRHNVDILPSYYEVVWIMRIK